MVTPKRKIRAKPFVQDLRAGMGDEDLMQKYTLSPLQLHKVFSKLVTSGAIDEMELFMRSSLSDSTISKAFVETDLEDHGPDRIRHSGPHREVDSKAEVEITEHVQTSTDSFSKMISKLTGRVSQGSGNHRG